jgi:mono/diheme cytochrome c family protein
LIPIMAGFARLHQADAMTSPGSAEMAEMNKPLMETISRMPAFSRLRARPVRMFALAPMLMMAMAAALFATPPALADKAAVARGQKVVDEWCRDCHVREGEQLTADMAPPYSAIVAIDGRGRAWFEKFLKDDHFPMTTFRLFDHEKADVVEWMLDLQKKQK